MRTQPARVHVIAPAPLGTTALAALRARGIDAQLATSIDSVSTDEIIAYALGTLPTAATAVELGATCAAAAANLRPLCLLAPPLDPPARTKTSRAAIERAAAIAYLRANGAALAHDADAWLESIVLLARHGLPRGPRVAVVAPAGSWLEAQALVLVAEADKLDVRAPLVGLGDDDATDVVLYDPAAGSPPASTRQHFLAIPVAARGELATDPTHLHTTRAALGAVALLGRAAERIAIGLGPAPASASAELAIDNDRLQRQLAKVAGDRRLPRIGDHETKVLLSAYGIPITRQAVATTPSAAVKVARKAGYPVEVKPWGNDLPSESAGCPVEKASSDALVRAAFTSVLTAAGKPTAPDDPATAVIVREAPPAGRDVTVTLLELPALGWTVVLEAPGAGIVAAPAPLRLLDAQSLAAQVVSSRAGDAEPDRAGLANLLRRASHLVIDLAKEIQRLDLSRVVVGGRGTRTLVIDAATELR
ncbi:MAG TPA: acetate--CoA ligase family protein [Kofleriaceae bacterium]|jgi:hypothetical protein